MRVCRRRLLLIPGLALTSFFLYVRSGEKAASVAEVHWSALDFVRSVDFTVASRPSAYQLASFVNTKNGNPLFEYDVVAAQLVADGIFPHVGMSLAEKDRKKVKLPKQLGSIIGPLPSNYESPKTAASNAVTLNGYPPRLIPVSAVLINWNTLANLKAVVNHIQKYPFIREILIWNNNEGITILPSTFEKSSDGQVNIPPAVRVFNPKENVQDMARYITCSMAKHSVCYFQDGDWVNVYMDSLYTSFIRHPSLIHSIAVPIPNIEHRRWTFASPSTSPPVLHSGFTGLGGGSFVPKSMTQRFLTQIGHVEMPRQRLNHADMYFSLWTNQYPTIFENSLFSFNQGQAWSAPVHQSSLLYANMMDAVKILAETVNADPENQQQDQFPREEMRPYLRERDSRALCHNDACIFFTSLDPISHPENRTLLLNDEAKSNAARHSDNFLSYQYAVDGDGATCWKSIKIPKRGEYFGVQLVTPNVYKQVTLISSHPHVSDLENSFTVSVSLDGFSWKVCKQADVVDLGTLPNTVRRPLCGGTQLVSYIKFVAVKDCDVPLKLCGITLDTLIL